MKRNEPSSEPVIGHVEVSAGGLGKSSGPCRVSWLIEGSRLFGVFHAVYVGRYDDSGVLQ